MRFHTTHLMGLVVVAALVFAVIRHPESLIAAVVPLIGGVFVVVPVLGLVELLTPRSEVEPRIGWGGAVLVTIVALVGSMAAMVVGLILLSAL
jgi:hypothetical protein